MKRILKLTGICVCSPMFEGWLTATIRCILTAGKFIVTGNIIMGIALINHFCKGLADCDVTPSAPN